MNAFGSRTHVGYVRQHNEDSLLVAPPIFVVCDGMGGHEAGEIASEIAVGTIASRAQSVSDAASLGQIVEEANLQIMQAAQEGRGKEGMGTTCTAAYIKGETLSIAQCGDSRAYLLHQGNLQQLTRDHSVVADLIEMGEISTEEARTHRWRSYITRALGLDAYVKPDLYEINIASGDRLMLCSDGLYSMVSDRAIAETLGAYPDPQRCADELVEQALSAGGNDNITVVVVDIEGYAAQRSLRYARRARRTAIILIIAMLLIMAGLIGSLTYWVNNSAYLGEVDGKVAIYKGMHDSLFGIELSSLEEVTEVRVDSLQPGTAERIARGEIQCDSVQAARELVNGYERQS